MKIIFISSRIPFPANKGEKIRVYNQLKYLSEKGMDISILSLFDKKYDNESCINLEKTLPIRANSFPLRFRFFGYFLGILMNKPLSIEHFYSTNLQNELYKRLEKNKYDAIICSSSAMFEYIKKLSNRSSLILVDFMDLDSDKWLQYANKSRGLKKLIYQREAKLLSKYEKRVQQEADYCIFTSQTEVDLFSKQVEEPSNIIAIGNGLDFDYFKPTVKTFNNESPIFIFTGVMDYLPNEDAVTWFCKEVWSEILKQKPNARFIIAGMNPTQQVKSLQELPGVEITGFVNDIRDYYQQADIFIAPLRMARGVQNKVLEAFASNIPVISTPNAIQGINCEPEQHLLQAKNKDDFIYQINRLLDDDSLRSKLSENALKLIHTKYSWQEQLQNLDKLIKRNFT